MNSDMGGWRNTVGTAVALGLALVVMLALGGCETVQESRKSSRASDQLEQAKAFERQGMLDSALAAFGLAIEDNPSLIEAHMGMGDVYRQKGDYEQAGKAYERAANLAPNSFEAHYYWGLMQQLLGKVDEAVKIYLRALAIEPDSPGGNEHLASAYLQLNRPAEALPYAKRAADLQPESQSAWANLAANYSLLGRYDDAIDAYRTASKLGPIQEEILLGLANAHLKLEHWDRATAVLEQAIRLKPSSTSYERLGYAQFKQRKFDPALASFRAALSIDGNDVAALNGLGVTLMTLYIQTGRETPALRDDALASWRKSVQLRGEQPRIVDLISRYQRL